MHSTSGGVQAVNFRPALLGALGMDLLAQKPPVDRPRQLRQRMAHVDDLIQTGAKQIMLTIILRFTRSHSRPQNRYRSTESQPYAP
ncbi:hypothetical protein AA11237_3181 [Acidocella aminolytica 101 = DSM 11237]|nr:hypothetical protein AA11237_3181 [Acidocella aminolytica 101 = DSM 11237]